MRPSRFLSETSGASVVEFALLIAPFLLLVFGIVEVSRALWTRQALNDVAAATARCVGVSQAECTDDGDYDPEKARAFAMAQARGRAIELAEDDIFIERGVECDGMTGAVSTALRGNISSVFPFEIVFDFNVRACFLDWSAL